jgi:small subunit ribosomal protein S6
MSLRRVYETTFIVNAALEDGDIESVISKVKSYIENHGAEIIEINKWGRRRLAYPINKKYNGFYVHIVFESTPATVPILERFLVLEDTVLRHLTLILPTKLKEFRAKRSISLGMVMGVVEPEPEKVTAVAEEVKNEEKSE